MFAFSQIISTGNKVSDVTKAIEQQNATPKEDVDEDMAVLAFSNTLPGNDGAAPDVKTDPHELEQEAQAQKELDELSNNEQTAALASLAQSEDMQSKFASNSADSEKDPEPLTTPSVSQVAKSLQEAKS